MINKELIIKLLNSSNSDDVKIGIEFLLNMGYNKAKNIVNNLTKTTRGDSWHVVGCDTKLWGYFNSNKGTFRIIIAQTEILIIYRSEEYVGDRLGWKSLH